MFVEIFKSQLLQTVEINFDLCLAVSLFSAMSIIIWQC